METEHVETEHIGTEHIGTEHMGTEKAKQIPVAPGLFSTPDPPGKPYLTANKCAKCGEIYFPQEALCLRCGNPELEQIALSDKGALYTFTIIRQQPPVYKGPVPYAIGIIELPERIRMTALLTQCDYNALAIGMEMSLVIEKLHSDDQGNEVLCYKFEPVF